MLYLIQNSWDAMQDYQSGAGESFFQTIDEIRANSRRFVLR
jgi:hypothetical protein